MATVYISRENNDHVEFVNDTGGNLDQYQPCVVGPYAAVADQAVTGAVVASFHVEEGLEVQADNLTTAEDTFATPGQPVYLDAVAGDFSDTETPGYYLWGYLKRVKDASGVIVIEKRRYAVLIGS